MVNKDEYISNKVGLYTVCRDSLDKRCQRF